MEKININKIVLIEYDAHTKWNWPSTPHIINWVSYTIVFFFAVHEIINSSPVDINMLRISSDHVESFQTIIFLECFLCDSFEMSQHKFYFDHDNFEMIVLIFEILWNSIFIIETFPGDYFISKNKYNLLTVMYCHRNILFSLVIPVHLYALRILSIVHRKNVFKMKLNNIKTLNLHKYSVNACLLFQLRAETKTKR